MDTFFSLATIDNVPVPFCLDPLSVGVDALSFSFSFTLVLLLPLPLSV